MLFRVTEVESATSTNDLIKQAIDEGASEGCAYRAKIQTGGYGRYGRAWASPEGGLYMSVLLRPDDHASTVHERKTLASNMPTLSLVVAIAVRRAISEQLACLETGAKHAQSIRIKWPNDVVLDPKVAQEALAWSTKASFYKLVGISVEKHHSGICIGIGVNVMRPSGVGNASDSERNVAQTLPAQRATGDEGVQDLARQHVRNHPVYLADLDSAATKESIADLSQRILSHLKTCYLQWLEDGFALFAKEFNECSVLNGCFVQMERQDGSVEVAGKVVGIDDHGSLLVKSDSDGKVLPVVSGEAHVILG